MKSDLIRYVFLYSLKDKTFIGFFVLIALIFSMSLFFGSSAVMEKQEFALVYLASSMRIVTIMAVVLIVSFFVRRIFETREIDFFLSLPITRIRLLLSLAGAFAILASLMAAFLAVPLMVLAPAGVSLASGGIWVFTVMVEAVLMAWVSLFFAFVLPSAAGSALMALMFYTLCRLLALILGILKSGVAVALPVFPVIDMIMKAISILLPRFDLMGQSVWLVMPHVPFDTIWLACIQFGVFGFLILSAAAFDLYRREF